MLIQEKMHIRKLYIHLNTSNVNVNRRKLSLCIFSYSYLNTSNVNVNHNNLPLKCTLSLFKYI